MSIFNEIFTKKYYLIIVLSSLLVSCSHLNKKNITDEELKNSIVYISSTIQNPYFYRPWVWRSPLKQRAQGVVVGKDLVLTLASVAKNAKVIELNISDEPLPIPMSVVAIDLNTNLALLKGPLPAHAKPISIPSTSKFTRSAILKLYFKTQNGIIRKGSAELDRMITNFNHNTSQVALLAKAVKSTHSNIGEGTPVFDINNKFYGLAIRGGDNYNFHIINCNTINKVLNIASATKNEKIAVAGFRTMPLTQKYYRQKLGITENNKGCLISKVFGQGSGCKQLKEGDILLSVCGKKLNAWGKYKNSEYGPISYMHIFPEHYVSEDFPITILRDKKIKKINLQLSDIDDDKWIVSSNIENKKSQYVIRGGYIFTSLAKTYIKEWGANYLKDAPLSLITLINNNYHEVQSDTKEEFIILSEVISHPTNIGIQNLNNQIIEEVNGKPIKNIKELFTILNDLKEDVIKFKFKHGSIPLWLSKKVLLSADQDIRMDYGIQNLHYIK